MKRGLFGIAACAALESFALFATVTVDLAEEVGRIKPTVRIGSREGRPILVYNEDNSHYFIRFASGGTVTEEGLRGVVSGYIESKGLKYGAVLWPLRIALSGREATPGGAYEIGYLLGKDESLRRLETAVARLKAM